MAWSPSSARGWRLLEVPARLVRCLDVENCCDSIWAEGWWNDWCEMWGVVTGAQEYDTTVADLAHEYRDACRAVQSAWLTLIRTPVRDKDGYDDFKKRASGEYFAATLRARDARHALLTFASSGWFECGTGS